MKKLFIILLSVMIMGISGCDKVENRIETKNDKEVNNSQETATKKTDVKDVKESQTSLNDNTKKVEDVTTEPVQKKQEEENATETKNTQQTAVPSKETVDYSKGADNGDVVTSKPTEQQTVAPTSAPTVNPTPKPTEKPTEKPTKKPTIAPTPKPESKKEYSPDKVVKSAIAKCEANGMITTEHNLDNLLADGTITQEEYDSYYPLDGLDNSYFSVFVNVDLNKATTVAGERLTSESAIADYISGMLLLESEPEFNIKNVGTYKSNGETFYEFRCYR